MTRDARSQTQKDPRVCRAEVGHVRTVGGDGVTSTRDWVRCARQGGCVAAERCAECRDCAAISQDVDGRVTSVHCLPQMGEPSLRPARLQVTVCSVAEVMTRDVLCVREDLSLESVLCLFVERGFKSLPVLDGEGALVGMISESDVVADVHAAAGTGEHTAPAAGPLEPGMGQRDAVRTVADVMAPAALSVREDDPVTQAAAWMADGAVHRLAVLSSDGRVVGLLSAVDVLAWLASAGGLRPANSPGL